MNYKDGRTLKIYRCRDYKKQISIRSGVYGSGYCKKCIKKGKRNYNYVDGHCIQQHYCIICNKKISYNTAIGKEALRLNTTGEKNTAIGLGALMFNIIGNRNVAIGNGA